MKWVRNAGGGSVINNKKCYKSNIKDKLLPTTGRADKLIKNVGLKKKTGGNKTSVTKLDIQLNMIF